MQKILSSVVGLSLMVSVWVAQAVEYASNPLTHADQLVVSDQGITAYDSVSLNIRWRQLTGEKTHEPVLAGDLILVSSSSGLHAIEFDSGNVRWHIDTWTNLFPATVGSGVAYLASEEGVLRALALNRGELLWQRQLPGWIYPPVIEGDRLYTGGSDGTVWAVDRDDGRVLWARKLGQEMVYSPLSNRDGGVIVTTFAGDVLAFSATGQLLWRTTLPTVPASAVELGGRFLFSGLDRQLYALDGRTGELLWNRPLGGHLAAPLVRHLGLLLAALDDGRLIGFDIQTGKVRELHQADGEPVASPAVQGERTVLFLKSFKGPKAVILKRLIGNHPVEEI